MRYSLSVWVLRAAYHFSEIPGYNMVKAGASLLKYTMTYLLVK